MGVIWLLIYFLMAQNFLQSDAPQLHPYVFMFGRRCSSQTLAAAYMMPELDELFGMDSFRVHFIGRKWQTSMCDERILLGFDAEEFLVAYWHDWGVFEVVTWERHSTIFVTQIGLFLCGVRRNVSFTLFTSTVFGVIRPCRRRHLQKRDPKNVEYVRHKV